MHAMTWVEVSGRTYPASSAAISASSAAFSAAAAAAAASAAVRTFAAAASGLYLDALDACTRARVLRLTRGLGSGKQGLTLVHFSAQLEPCLTQEYTLHTLNTT